MCINIEYMLCAIHWKSRILSNFSILVVQALFHLSKIEDWCGMLEMPSERALRLGEGVIYSPAVVCGHSVSNSTTISVVFESVRKYAK